MCSARFLHMGRPADAEMVYRADLESHPHNGWAILGLRDALSRGVARQMHKNLPILPKAWAREMSLPPHRASFTRA